MISNSTFIPCNETAQEGVNALRRELAYTILPRSNDETEQRNRINFLPSECAEQTTVFHSVAFVVAR